MSNLGDTASTMADTMAGTMGGETLHPAPTADRSWREVVALAAIGAVVMLASLAVGVGFLREIRQVQHDLPDRVLRQSLHYSGLALDTESVARLAAVMVADYRIDETETLLARLRRIDQRVAALTAPPRDGDGNGDAPGGLRLDAEAERWLQAVRLRVERAVAAGDLASPRTMVPLAAELQRLNESVARGQEAIVADAESSVRQQRLALSAARDQAMAVAGAMVAGLALLIFALASLFRQTRMRQASEREAGRAVRQRLALQERYARMFRDNRAMQLLIDAQSGVIVEANPSALDRFGVGPLAGVPLSRALVLPPPPANGRALPVEDGTLVLPLAEGEGEIELHLSALSDGSGTLLYAIGHDVTDRNRLMRDLEHLATTDALTGLANRRQFFAVAGREQARGQRSGHPFSILAFDIDRFKRVNDRHGHATGDRVIAGVAAIAAANLRASDTLARLGGEEFAVLCPETTLDEALAVAERLRRMIAAADFPGATPGAPPLRITVSVGVAGVDSLAEGPAETEGDDRLADLLGRADAALYRAKEQGRDRVEAAAPVPA